MQAAGSNHCIEMNKEHSQVIIKNPVEGGEEKAFTYDYVYDSCLPEDHIDYASQDTVWGDLGTELLEVRRCLSRSELQRKKCFMRKNRRQSLG